MSAFFHWLSGAAVAGSVAIVLTLLLVPVVRRIFGARAAHMLWLFPLALLLSPAIPRSPVSVLPRGTPDVPALVVRVVAPASAPVSSRLAAPPARPAFPWTLALWASGAGALLGMALVRGARAFRLSRGATDVTASLRDICDGLGGLPRRVRICETPRLSGPAVCGLFRPVILLPVGWAAQAGPEELRWMLLHEIGHIRRGDLLWRWVFQVARALHWFNPLVWIAERASRVDQEMACDEWVLERRGARDGADYGEALLRTARQAGRPGERWLVQAAMAESGLTRRIRHLASAHPRGKWAAGAVLVLGVAALLLLSPGVREVIRQIPGFARTPAQTQVEIEAKFLELNPDASAAIFGAGQPEAQAILDPAELHAILLRLQGQKGVDVVSSPRVSTRPGSKARIQIVREFRYPTAFNPPEKRPPENGSAQGILIPPTPTAFDMRPVGLTLEVEPEIAPDGRLICSLRPQVVEFEGFINYGSDHPERSAPNRDAIEEAIKSAPETSQMINQPVFQTREMQTTVALRPGQTVLLGGLNRVDKQMVSQVRDGQTVNTEKNVERVLYVLVTAHLKGGAPATQPPSAPQDMPPSPSDGPAPGPVPAPSPVSSGDLPYGTPVPNKPGFATSPWAPDQGWVDLRGFAPGTEVRCPYTSRLFRVP